MDIGLDNGYFDAVLSAPPLSNLSGRRGLTLTVEADHQDSLIVRLDFASGTEQADQFGVNQIHRVSFEFDAWTSFFFHQPGFDTLSQLLGLSDIEISL